MDNGSQLVEMKIYSLVRMLDRHKLLKDQCLHIRIVIQTEQLMVILETPSGSTLHG